MRDDVIQNGAENADGRQKMSKKVTLETTGHPRLSAAFCEPIIIDTNQCQLLD